MMINDKLMYELTALQEIDNSAKYDEFFEWLFIDNRQLLDIEKLEMTDISILCQAFHDKCFYFDFMFELIHIIEHIPGEISDYLMNIVAAIPKMIYGQEWAETLILRVLNTHKYSDEFIKVIAMLDEGDKCMIINMITKIKTKNSKVYGNLVDTFLKK